MQYLNSKGLGYRGHGPEKVAAEKVVTDDQWKKILDAVESTESQNPKWERDYATIFLACALGLRCGETCLLERNNFRDLFGHLGVAYLPTLKQSDRIVFQCRGEIDGEHCARKVRLQLSKSGQNYRCTRCGTQGKVPVVRGVVNSGAVERPVDVVEEGTVAYIQHYMDSVMRPDQKWFFEGRTPSSPPMSRGHMKRIFNTYAAMAGLSARYSTHALRHRRGVQLYSQFEDLVFVRDMLRQKDVKTTQVYADLDLEEKNQRRDDLNKKSFNPLKKRKKKTV